MNKVLRVKASEFKKLIHEAYAEMGEQNIFSLMNQIKDQVNAMFDAVWQDDIETALQNAESVLLQLQKSVDIMKQGENMEIEGQMGISPVAQSMTMNGVKGLTERKRK